MAADDILARVDADVQIRLKLASSRIRNRERIRGMVLFVIYFGVYSGNISRTIDWHYASVTFDLFVKSVNTLPGAYQDEVPYCDASTWTDQVMNLSCWYEFTDLENVEDMEYYFEWHMPKILTLVRGVCPECDVALTPMVRNVLSLTLEDYSCSDYETNAGPNQNQYNPREDCDEVNTKWVANPTVESAPCCNNETIVRASIVLMMQHAVDNGVINRPFDKLIPKDASRSDKRDSVVDVFARDQVSKENGYFFQVIISRNTRMVGIIYKASWIEKTAPGLVVPGIEFWSYRGDFWTEFMTVVAVVFNLLSASHNIVHLMQGFDKNWRKKFLAPHLWFIVATMLLPLCVTLSKSYFLSLTNWILFASVVQLLLLIRLTKECTAISAMKCLVRTLAVALKELSVLMIVIGLYVIVLGNVYGQLFGIFDYSSYFAAVMDIISQFSGGPVVSDNAQLYQPAGGVITYMFTMLVLFLILSQVFITVLMDAWEVASEKLREAKVEMMLPPGFTELPVVLTWDARMIDLLIGFTTGYSRVYQAYLPSLCYHLKTEVRQIETEEEQATSMMVSQAQIAKAVGVVTAERLALMWGAKPIPEDSTNDGGDMKVTSTQQPAQTRQFEIICPTETGSVSAVDEMAELRAEIFCTAATAGNSIPYSELLKLSRDSLKKLQGSFKDRQERDF